MGQNISHIQFPVNLLVGMNKEQRRYVAHYLRLSLRFQSSLIHPSLDRHVAEKAGMSQSNLRRVVKILMNPPEGVLPLLRLGETKDLKPLTDKASESYIRTDAYIRKHGSAYLLPTGADMYGDERIWHEKTLKGRRKKKKAGRPGLLVKMQERAGLKVCAARSTLLLSRSMDVHAIVKELNRKVFEYHMEQVTFAGDGSNRPRGEHALLRQDHIYVQHQALQQFGSPGIAMPSNAFSSKMGIGRRTFFRYVKHWVSQDRLTRTPRRVHLPPIDNPRQFQREWGIAPFCVGGLWYGQAPNLYESKVDYRGLLSAFRKERRMYGLKGVSLWKMYNGELQQR